MLSYMTEQVNTKEVIFLCPPTKGQVTRTFLLGHESHIIVHIYQESIIFAYIRHLFDLLAQFPFYLNCSSVSKA